MGQRRRRRRWPRVLAWIGAALVVAVGVLAGVLAWMYSDARVSTAGELEFANPLRIPELDAGRRDGDVVGFDLTLQTGETAFLAEGPATATWGVNGSYLGPTLRMRRGDTVQMAVDNSLPEASTLHWHGMHLPSSMDGGPHQMIPPGDMWHPTWTVDQPAATLWYHPHPHGKTAEHVYRGVAGMIIVDDPAESPDLPSTYGVDDVPLIVQDRDFDGDNKLRMSNRQMSNVGALGDELLVNGTHDPHFDVTTERVRLRLLNASNARFFEFGFDDGREFQLVGTDGGLRPAPLTLERIALSPGERAEIVVELAPSEDVVLRSFGGVDRGNFFWRRFNGHDDVFDVLQLRATDELEPSAAVPDVLAAVERLEPADAVTTRELRLSSRRINGQEMDISRIDEVVEVDTVEIWEVRNSSGVTHNFHVHDVQFQVLDVDGAAPPAELEGWKDTVPLASGDTVRLIMRFADYTDADTPYMFHCHILRHEDSGMMGQFVVVGRGESAGRVATDDHADHGDH